MAVRLPDEIILEILSFLPAKSLLRCRSVCKSWLSLMNSTKFKLMHLHNFNQLNSRYLVRHWYEGVELYSVHLDDEDLSIDGGTLVQVPLDVTYSSSEFRIAGCCNGVVCVCDDDNEDDASFEKIFLWNPSIRRQLTLTVPSFYPMDFTDSFCVLGFGYNKMSDDYKVVCLLYGNFIKTRAEVYSLKTGIWREVMFPDDLSCFIIHPEWSQVFFDGSVHWIARYRRDSHNSIMTFDTSSELFAQILLPDDLVEVYEDEMMISVLGESLAVTYRYPNMDSTSYKIWVMKEYKKPTSWMMIYNMHYPDIDMEIPLQLRNKADMMMESRDGNMIIHASVAPNIDMSFVNKYQESLVLLDVGDIVPNKKTMKDLMMIEKQEKLAKLEKNRHNTNMESNIEADKSILEESSIKEDKRMTEESKIEAQKRKKTKTNYVPGTKRKTKGECSSVKKKRKSNDAQQEEESEDRKENIDVDLSKSMIARTTLKNLILAISQLKTHQLRCLKKIGFEEILGLQISVIPSKLTCFVINNFDTKNMVIRIPAGEIKVDEEAVSQILGLKNEGEDLNEMECDEDWFNLLGEWKDQFQNGANIRQSDILQKLNESKNTTWKFKTNFIILFVNAMAITMKMGVCNISILPKLGKNIDFGRINWCKYIIQCAKDSKKARKKVSDEMVYSGPITFLTLLYLDSTTCDGIEHQRMRPAIKWWTSEKMKEREKKELSLGGFGLGKLKEPCVEPIGNKKKYSKEKKTMKEFETILNDGLEEIIANKEELESNFYQAINLYPRNKFMKKWKQTYEKSFQFKQKTVSDDEEEFLDEETDESDEGYIEEEDNIVNDGEEKEKEESQEKKKKDKETEKRRMMS